MVILAEELLLLALDDETGRAKGTHLKEALAAALLLDLSHAKRIALRNKRVTVPDPTPVGHPVLDRLLDTIGKQKWDLKPRSHVTNTRRDVKRRIADGLVEQGVLRADGDQTSRSDRDRRYRTIRPETQSEVRGRLDSMVASQTGGDARTSALGGLVYAGRLEKVALPGHQRRQVRGILKSAAQRESGAADWLILRGVMLAAVIGGQGNGAGGIGE